MKQVLLCILKRFEINQRHTKYYPALCILDDLQGAVFVLIYVCY